MAITQKVLLIGEAAIKAQSMIQLNADSKVLSRSILDTQFIYLRPIMGDALYDQVLTAVAASQPPTNPIVPLTDDLKTLIVEYIQPYLIHAVVQDTIINLHYKITGKGLLKYNDTQAVAISQDEIEYAKNYHDNRVTAYKGVLIRFLAEVYPLNSGGCNNGRDTDVTSEATGWLLGNAKGCGIDGPLPVTPPPIPPDPDIIPGNGTYFGSDHSINIGSNPEAPNEGLLRQNTLFSFMEDGTNPLVPYVKLDPLTGAAIGVRTVEMVDVEGTLFPDSKEATLIEATDQSVRLEYKGGEPNNLTKLSIESGAINMLSEEQNTTDPENIVSIGSRKLTVDTNRVQISVSENDEGGTLVADSGFYYRSDGLQHNVSMANGNTTLLNADQYTAQLGMSNATYSYGVGIDSFGRVNMIATQGGSGSLQQIAIGNTNDLSAHTMVVTDAINGRGLEYDSNYGETFTDRSLVDKAYVDNQRLFITPEMFGAVGDGITNDYVALQNALIAVASGGVLKALKKYNIANNRLNITGSSFALLGDNSGQVIGTNDILLQNSGALTDVLIDGLTLNGVGPADVGNYFGLFTSEDKAISRLTFSRCKFTGTSISNGVKIINQTEDLTDGINFIACNFVDLGQMGIEFQNHNYDGVSRYRAVKIMGCNFNNLGNVSAFGMAISFSGYGKDLIVDSNTVRQAKDIGIELAIRQENVIISNNIIREGKTGCAPFSFSNGTNTWSHGSVQIIGNQTESEARVNLYRLNNSIVANNKFYFTAPTGYVQITNMENSLVKGNRILSPGAFGLFCNHSTGKLFQYNVISDNYIRTTATNAACIQVDGVSSTDTTIHSNTLYKSTGGSFSAFTGGALGTSKYNYPNGISEDLAGTGWGIDNASNKFKGAGIGNFADTQNGEILTGATGLTLRIVNINANTVSIFRHFGTGRLADGQNAAGSRVWSLDQVGYFQGSGVINLSAETNAAVRTLTTGVKIERTLIASGGCPLTVNQGAVTNNDDLLRVGKADVVTMKVLNNGVVSTPNVITTGVIEYADNAAAIAAGLVVGTHYRTGDILKIVH